jgi:hypothetical protein
MDFQVVGVGEESGLVAAYRAAARSAERLSAALARAGLGEEMLFIVASVSEGGDPVVHVTMTAVGADRLASRLSRGGGGPPSRDRYDGSGAA